MAQLIGLNVRESLVDLCRQHNILSLVDAAHAIGQIPVNLSQSKPDYFISYVLANVEYERS